MALTYKLQGLIEKIAAKTSVTSPYKSDQRTALFGGRGGRYDELQYLRNQNTSAAGVDTKLSDAWVKFAQANSSGSDSNRFDQQYHDFVTNGSFP